MSGGADHVIVVALLAAAGLFAARRGWRAWRRLRAPNDACHCGCSAPPRSDD